MKKILRKLSIVFLSCCIWLSIGNSVARTMFHIIETGKTETSFEKFLDPPLGRSWTSQTDQEKNENSFFVAVIMGPVLLVLDVLAWIVYGIVKFLTWFGISLWCFIPQGGFYDTFGWWGILALIITLACIIWWKKIVQAIDEHQKISTEMEKEFHESQ